VGLVLSGGRRCHRPFPSSGTCWGERPSSRPLTGNQHGKLLPRRLLGSEISCRRCRACRAVILLTVCEGPTTRSIRLAVAVAAAAALVAIRLWARSFAPTSASVSRLLRGTASLAEAQVPPTAALPTPQVSAWMVGLSMAASDRFPTPMPRLASARRISKPANLLWRPALDHRSWPVPRQAVFRDQELPQALRAKTPEPPVLVPWPAPVGLRRHHALRQVLVHGLASA